LSAPLSTKGKKVDLANENRNLSKLKIITIALFMNIKQKYYLVVLCLGLVRVVWAESSQGTLLDKIIANIDNQIILQSELETSYQEYLLQVGKEIPDLKCKILEQLILNKMLLARAKQEGVVVERETIAQALSEEIQYLLAQAGSEAKLVQHWNKPIEEITSGLREKIKEQLMLHNMRRQLIEDIHVTPQEVKDFFDLLPEQKRLYYPAEVKVRQIVRYPQISQQIKEALITQLKALKVRLQNGEDFEVLAQEYSQDPGSKLQGGDLGFWRLGELDPVYEAAALALHPGEVSDPVATQFGYHLIQLIVREKDRYNSRHILLKYGPDVLGIEVIKEQLAQLRTDILAGKVTFEQAAIKSSEDPLTAPNGGLLKGEHGGVRMLIDELPPDVYFVIEQLAPGTISDLMLFTTADDREAVKIIFLEEKIAPHQINLAQDYEKIKQLLINNRKEAKLQRWFEHVKASTSIHVAPEYQNCALFR
jgi:peptidyl-prolyl cis-trans isomerase SurA